MGEKRSGHYSPVWAEPSRPTSSGYYDDDATPPKGTRALELDSQTNGAAETAVESVELTYARSVNLPRLRARIEAQDLSARTNFTEIVAAMDHSLAHGGNLILEGPTGSGKSLYGPLAAREMVRAEGAPDHVVVLEPRRDAASGVGTAMAAVAGEPVVGETIGFSTAEARQVRVDTNIKVVTQGIFLRWLKDGGLTKDKVGALVIDEVHEGSIEYHLILGLIKRMQERDEAPFVIFMSATPDTKKLQEFFGITTADCFKLEGRPHPVETFYAEKTTGDYLQDTVDTVRTICASRSEGDVLVFLPGAGEIKQVIRQLGPMPGTEILPLHGQLPPEARNAALADSTLGVRRIIVATNIAETSLTIPGVRYVVDSARERDVRYDHEAGITRKGTGFIAQAQARQRAGRAGRTAPGEYHCLLSKAEFDDLRELPESDIHRQNLSHLVLQLKHLGIEPVDFPFIDPPPAGALQKAIEELQTLGALGETGRLTPIGEKIGELKYFEPRIGRMLIEGRRQNCIEAALVLAAFERETKVLLPLAPEAEEARLREWAGTGKSDWRMRLNIFEAAYTNGLVDAATKSNRHEENRFYNWCRQHGFNAQALIHIAVRLDDYATAAEVETDPPDRFMEKIHATSGRALTRTIVAGHPDAVLLNFANFGYANVSAAVAIANKTPNRPQPIMIDRRSAGYYEPPMMCIAKVSEAGRDKRLFAEAVHPVMLNDLINVAPELLEVTRDDGKYHPHTEKVETTTHYYPRGLKNKADYELGQQTEPVTDPLEVTRAFARALASDDLSRNFDETHALKKINEQNLDQFREAQRLALLSGGRVRLPDSPYEVEGWLAEWYAKKLGRAHFVETAYAIRDQLELSPEDIIPPNVLKELETWYPNNVEILGRHYSVNYKPGPPIQAHIELYATQSVLELRQDNIPTLGPPDAPLQPILWFNDKSSPDVTKLQEQADQIRLYNLFQDSKYSGERIRMHLDDTQTEIPSPEALGYTPIEFAKNFHNEPAYAYPGIVYDGYHDTYHISYFLTSEEAKKETTRSQHGRAQVVAEHTATAAARLAHERAQREQERARLEADRLQAAYEIWRRAHPPESVDARINRTQTLPTPVDLGYDPIAYASDANGQPIFAYPCLTKSPRSFDRRVPDTPYKIEYLPTEVAAKTEQGKTLLNHEHQRDALVRREALRVVVDRILKEIETIEPRPDNPFTPNEIFALKQRLRNSLDPNEIQWIGAVRTVADAEKISQEIKDAQNCFQIVYLPLRHRVVQLREALIKSGQTILLNRDSTNAARIPSHPTRPEYIRLCTDWEFANKYIKDNDIEKRNFTGLKPAIGALRDAETWFSSLIQNFEVQVRPTVPERRPVEPVPEPEQQKILDELRFLVALLETAYTPAAKEIKSDLTKLIIEITTQKNVAYFQAAINKIRHRAAEALRPAGYSREQLGALHAAYQKILTERVPAVEREYGGRISPEALSAIQPALIDLAKKWALASDDFMRKALQEEIDEVIAEAL